MVCAGLVRLTARENRWSHIDLEEPGLEVHPDDAFQEIREIEKVHSYVLPVIKSDY
jgi:hypothetical protein